ncbi:hypothetical protein DXG03_006443 [Asterophora parasitica]|uniref:Uncharacterized protein n=1 Tax=Asterophora parasitica TaxID=117018 RepID=A0A9P7G542_9AGAR|nr:hypothetical protein DXG03_006443 [Asterophora parasitica]
MEVLGSTNGTAVNIDYILYSPGFATLAGKPSLGAPAGTGTGTTSTTVATPTETGGVTNGMREKNGGVLVGAVVGGVVGGVVVLALLFLVLIMYRRRAAEKRALSELPSTASIVGEREPGGSFSIDPFTAAPVPAASYYRKGPTHVLPLDPSLPPTTSHNPSSGSYSRSGSPVATTIHSLEPATLPTSRPMVQHKLSPSSSSILSSIPRPSISSITPSPLVPFLGANSDSDGYFPQDQPTSPSTRVEDLVRELEAAAAGGEREKAAELRGRIAELTRQVGGSTSGREMVSEVPPPYRDDRDV